jgi:hypothetical protein
MHPRYSYPNIRGSPYFIMLRATSSGKKPSKCQTPWFSCDLFDPWFFPASFQHECKIAQRAMKKFPTILPSLRSSPASAFLTRATPPFAFPGPSPQLEQPKPDGSTFGGGSRSTSFFGDYWTGDAREMGGSGGSASFSSGCKGESIK